MKMKKKIKVILQIKCNTPVAFSLTEKVLH